MPSSLEQYPQRDGLYRILPSGVAVHNRYQNRVVLLDSLSSELWLRTDGKTKLWDIARDISGMSNESASVVSRAVAMLAVILNSEGLMYLKDTPAPLPYHLASPQEDQDPERMRASMAAAGWLEE
jgi:hypothetical protein